MTFILSDRIKETTTTTGTGTVTLAGTSTSYATFGSALANADTTYYCIVDNATGDWEVGEGTYTTAGTLLSRDTVLESSNADALVVFAAGTKEVFITYPADKSVYLGMAGFNSLGIDDNATSTALTIDSAGLVGIGIAVPEEYLHIKGVAETRMILESAGSGQAILEIKAGGTGTKSQIFFGDSVSDLAGKVTYSHSANEMTFDTNNAVRMTLDSSGNLGIGETVSLGKLHVKTADSGTVAANVNADELILENSSNAGMSILSGVTGTGAMYFGDSSQVTVGGFLYDHTSNYLAIRANNAERMRIDSAGNVGIGETAPKMLLDVGVHTGAVWTPDADTRMRLKWWDNVYFDIVGGSGAEVAVNFGDNDDEDVGRVVYSHSTNHMRFHTNAAERMRIDSAGNVGIGMVPTASIYGDIPRLNTLQLAGISDWDTDAICPLMYFSKSRGGGVVGTHGVVLDNDWLGAMVFGGSDGTDFAGHDSAFIRAEVDGTPAANSVPAALVLGTNAAGDSFATERMRIRADGKVGINQNPTNTVYDFVPTVGINGYLGMSNWLNTNGSADIYFTKSRNTTPGSHTIVQDNDVLMFQAWTGSDGVGFGNASGYIRAKVQGTPAANSIPCELTFATTEDGGTNPVERLNINNKGTVGIGELNATSMLQIKGNLTTALTGTVSVTAATDAVTGVGTAFLTELDTSLTDGWDGYAIKIGTEVFTVSAIASDTALTLDSNHVAGASAVTAYTDPDLFSVHTGDDRAGVTINPFGHLGIGTDTPEAILHVEGDSGVIRLQDSTATTDILMQTFLAFHRADGTQRGYVGYGWDGNNSLNITNQITAGDIKFTCNTGVDMYIADGGSVGIGQTTVDAAVKLDVNGGVRAAHHVVDTTNGIYRNSATSTMRISGGSDSFSGGNIRMHGETEASTPNIISFFNNTTEQTRMDASGNWDFLNAALTTTGKATAKAHISDYASFQISTATDHGGANATVVAAVWDGTELHKDTQSFTHSTVTNPSRVTIVETGRYHLKGVMACDNAGTNRQTLATRYRIDAGTWITLGAQQSYSRGSIYNSVIRAPFDFEVDITAASYVEIGTIVEDTDASATALATTDSIFIIRRIG